MKRMKFLAGLVALAALADGCLPVVTVQNKTSFVVRAVVTNSGHSQVLSPSPGESSAAEVEEGPYRVTIIPDQEWLDHANATRQFLNDQLAHSDTLTGPQLLEVVRRLKEIAASIKAYENTAGNGAACAGQITQDGGGSVTVSAATDGTILVSCQ